MFSAASGLPPWQSTSHPAYVPVSARNPYSSVLPPPPTYVPQPLQQSAQHAATSQASQAATSTPESRKKVEWSPAIRAYVQRSFADENQIPGVSRAELEAKMRQLITQAADSNTLNTAPWATMDLPQQLIQKERNRAMLGFHNFPPPPPLPFFPSVSQAFQIPPPPLPPQIPDAQTLRKRKSSELTDTLPPWRNSAVNKSSLESRMTAPDKRQKLDTSMIHSKSNANLESRKRRFQTGSNSPHSATGGNASPVPSEPLGPVVGTSQKLEKNYFRLTSAPKPEEVRPLSILKQTLELLKKKWRQDSNYVYICDQFKSLRQDLTVQHIKDEFTTSVYEIHARIALEKGDLGEYNQCQTQLRSLYKLNLGGHATEFKAYRILYTIYTCNRADMNDVLSDLTSTDKASKEVKHALAVRSALALGNYHQFFKLYLDPPNMGAYLMDMFIVRERLNALAHICRAYNPSVRLRFITEELAFETDEEAANFILEYADKEVLDDSQADHVRLLTKKSRAFEDAKAAAYNRVDIKGQI